MDLLSDLLNCTERAFSKEPKKKKTGESFLNGIVEALSKGRQCRFCINESLCMHHFWFDALFPRKIPSPSFFPHLSKSVVQPCHPHPQLMVFLYAPYRVGGLRNFLFRWAASNSSFILSPCSVLPMSLLNTAGKPESRYFRSTSPGLSGCILVCTHRTGSFPDRKDRSNPNPFPQAQSETKLKQQKHVGIWAEKNLSYTYDFVSKYGLILLNSYVN